MFMEERHREISEALQANGKITIAEIAGKILPKDYQISWTGLSLQEVEAAGLATFLIILALVFCYLFIRPVSLYLH